MFVVVVVDDGDDGVALVAGEGVVVAVGFYLERSDALVALFGLIF